MKVYDAGGKLLVSLASDLDNLADVVITSAADHDMLYYDLASTNWVNGVAATIVANLGITASIAELNLLDLAGLTAGQLLVATAATTAAWQSTGVKLSAPDISGTVTAASTLTMPAFTSGGDILGQATYDLGSAASPFAEAYIGNTNDYLKVAVVSNIPTIYGTGAYLRIGDNATTQHSLDSEDDLMVSGELEVKLAAWFGASVNLGVSGSVIYLSDDALFSIGTGIDGFLIYETADPNAKCVMLALPHTDEDANNVPVLVLCDSNAFNVNLGFFDGQTIPRIALVAADRGGYFGFGVDNSDILDIIATTAPAAEVDETKFSHKLQCVINGATYYIMLTQT